MESRRRLPMEQRNRLHGARRNALRVSAADGPAVRVRLSTARRAARAGRAFHGVAGRPELAVHRPVQLFLARGGAARAVRPARVRGLLLARALDGAPLHQPPDRGNGQRDLDPARAQGLDATRELPGGASRPWYSWLSTL